MAENEEEAVTEGETEDSAATETAATETAATETAVVDADEQSTDAATADGSKDDGDSSEEVPEGPYRMNLDVTITDTGPCLKHIRVVVPRADLDHYQDESVDQLIQNADVPGFRKGHVPSKLVGKRFRREIADDVKQKILIESLEQLSAENELDPINEPDLDVENIEIPVEGDFEYEFDIEVRPEFDLPEYQELKLKRSVATVTDDDVEGHMRQFLEQYGEHVDHDGPAQKGDFVTITGSFEQVGNGHQLLPLSERTLRVNSVLRFSNAEVAGFDELMVGAASGDSREVEFEISAEASAVELRGEKVKAIFSVHGVKQLQLPELNKEFLDRIGVESEEELRIEISNTLERQTQYQQRQSCRDQIIDQITESANWELPEELVSKQVENAIHREMLEMQQAGFTTQQVQARENEIRQRSISTTRQAMKEHFILDKIATKENIEVTPSDIDVEIRLMANQAGESPRRLRARLEKTGVIENLEAQIRERMAIDICLERAVFEDVEVDSSVEDDVEAIDFAMSQA